jgi:small conductance mechanosensitive channel
VDGFDNSDIVIKLRIKTLPLKQWDVGRELRRRIKKTFSERGIEMPFPYLTVSFDKDTPPTRPA